MTISISHDATVRFGSSRKSAPVRALAALARHSSHDTVLIASLRGQHSFPGTPAGERLVAEDVDGLAMVIRELRGQHLDLVLHGSCVGRDVANDIFSLLRGRYEVVRALVPTQALSIMSLIALACEKAIMLDTAVVGAADVAGQPQMSSTEAADWLARNCRNPDVEDRVGVASMLFAADENQWAPVTAAHARDLGLHIDLVGERSGIGNDLQVLDQALERLGRFRSSMKLIANHRGTLYTVEN